MKNVVIFRNQLFKVSETFITEQASSLINYKPIFVGRKLYSKTNFDAVSLDKCSLIENLRFVFFRDVRCLEKELRGERIDLIHCHFGVDSIYAYNLSKKLNVPLVITLHGIDATIKKWDLLKSMRPAYLNYLFFRSGVFEKCKKIICVSNFIRGTLKENYELYNKSTVHYIGTDLNKAPNLIEKKKFSILHVARLTEKKGTKYLIKAFSEVLDLYSEARLDIIGEGPLENELIKLVDKLGLTDKVYFHGAMAKDEVMNYMASSSIFCVPSVTAKNGDSEGLGMVFLEAALSKSVVVSTDHGGIPEAVIDGETGFLVDERNHIQIRDGILKLFSDDELLKVMADNAFYHVIQNFDVCRQSLSLEVIYDEVISK